MSTLEAELLQAAKRADIAAWLHDKRRNVTEYEEAVAESAALRARAARAVEYERLAVIAVERAKTQDNPSQLRLAELRLETIRALTGPLNPDSAGGTAP